jgi:hypothetical protein
MLNRSAELKYLTKSFLERVVIHKDSIQVLINRSRLRRLLQQGKPFVSGSPEGAQPADDATDLICLTVEAKLKRCGGEVRLLVPPDSAVGQAAELPKASLIKAIARAHSWHQKLLEGKAHDQTSLARQAGVTERYVARVLGCAFLAPDIVEAILEGC